MYSNPQMERFVNFVGEWFSLEEMKVLQCVSVLTSVWAREWQYKDILIDFDDQVWKDLSENWQSQRKEKVLPCEVRHWSTRRFSANERNSCATEVSACLKKNCKHCYSHVSDNLGERSIPSDHVAVRIVIQKPSGYCDTIKRIPSWTAKHPVFCSILKQISDDYQYFRRSVCRPG